MRNNVDMKHKVLVIAILLLVFGFSVNAKIGLSVKAGGAFDCLKGKSAANGNELDPFEFEGEFLVPSSFGIELALGYDFSEKLGLYMDFISTSPTEVRYSSESYGHVVIKKDEVLDDGIPLPSANVSSLSCVIGRTGLTYAILPDSKVDVRVGGGFSFNMIKYEFSYVSGDATYHEKLDIYNFGIAGYVYTGYRFGNGFSAGLLLQPDLFVYNISTFSGYSMDHGIYNALPNADTKGFKIGFGLSASIGLSYTF